jgi:hypothetical protein
MRVDALRDVNFMRKSSSLTGLSCFGVSVTRSASGFVALEARPPCWQVTVSALIFGISDGANYESPVSSRCLPYLLVGNDVIITITVS